MIYLALSILASTGIFVLFKLFRTYKVDTLQAIVVNYITASVCGFIHNSNPITIREITGTRWFIAAICLGFLFIAIFNVMALTAQKNGLSVASVASKMSVIIPVLFGILVFNEGIGIIKVIGISIALVAVYLTSVKERDNTIAKSGTLLLPIILFLGSGTIDTSINYFAPDDKIPLFSAVIFAFAFIIGCAILAYRAIKLKRQFSRRSIPLGFILGVVNYGSIYFLLKALRIDGLESSVLFTVNNVAIVASSTLVGLLVFREYISRQNWLGIVLALISIILVTLI
ncbi:EamA-like transporter family protein [Winogradskyella wandonensis]|uniref:EamA-like transporter family protein n=1 Tax=Winogradskyella wandonensis TaxID=1442586 RepID=A0A4R1KK55_9FLAO|nr:EamA family transporter [Winogradskyella wandonensis]TCK64723.1 EamA-like transporter family protein [Winogradskyella wandonensis]